MVPLVDVECIKKCAAIVKVGLSRFQMPIGELGTGKRVPQIASKTSGKFI